MGIAQQFDGVTPHSRGSLWRYKASIPDREAIISKNDYLVIFERRGHPWPFLSEWASTSVTTSCRLRAG